MDKIKQNIDLQEAIQRYNIEKSVVGTLAYNIDQNLQKGMSPDEAIEDVLQKSKSMPIGTIHNGFKKIAEGKWRKVSEHGMTKEEHANEYNKTQKTSSKKDQNLILEGKKKEENTEMSYKDIQKRTKEREDKEKLHKEAYSKLDSKNYSEEEVTGGEKKEGNINSKIEKFLKAKEGSLKIDQDNSIKPNWKDVDHVEIDGSKFLLRHVSPEDKYYSYKLLTEKSQPESTLSKSEQKEKVANTMNSFNKGILKSNTGELITDRSEALRFALSEAGIEIEKSGGEGSKGGKVIGHTKSGKPIYATNAMNHKHSDFTSEDHKEAAEKNREEASKHFERARKMGPSIAQTKVLDQRDLHNQFAKEHETKAFQKQGK